MSATLLTLCDLSFHGVAAKKIIGAMDHMGKGEGEVVIPVKFNDRISINFSEGKALLQMNRRAAAAP